MTEQTLDKQKEGIGAAIGRIPSGVFIITAANAQRKTGPDKVGMLASWVQQVGFEPPTIAIAVHPDRELYGLIAETGRFTVNVMSDTNMNLMKPFSRYSPEQFDGLDCNTGDYGVILNETVAYLECTLKEKVAAADHHLLIGEVKSGGLLNGDHTPFTHLRKSGFNY